ncbi:hypothetical protein BJV78DRAFT_1152206 [Lactifluus subvellereus]|nr:hypothetical protein BJV78DRAFT_1152206 [Lactifluus subvellereus]
MSSTRPSCDTLVQYPVLTSSQRSRLVKSTRKLTKILGETPILLVKPPSPKLLASQKSKDNSTASQVVSVTKRLARAVLHPLRIVRCRDVDSDSSSMRSSRSGLVAEDTPSHWRGWSPVPFFAEKASPEAEADDCDTFVSSHVPSPNPSSRKRPSSLISVATSNSLLLSPTELGKWREGLEAHSRRRRLSKLARYLGESIPSDLILPNRGSSLLSGESSRSSLSPPDYTPPVPPVVPALLAEPPMSEQKTHLSPPPPSLTPDVPQPAVEKAIEVFESIGRTPSLRSTSDAETHHPFAQEDHWCPRSEYAIFLPSQGFMQPCIDVNDNADARSLKDYDEQEVGVSSRPTSPLAFLRLRQTAPSPGPKAVSHRSERRQGWSGEWNAASIQDVISKLRDL